jgi:hypothetical protein
VAPAAPAAPEGSLEYHVQRYLGSIGTPVRPEDRPHLLRFAGQLADAAARVQALIGETGRQLAAQSAAIRIRRDVSIAVPGGISTLPAGTIVSTRKDGPDYYRRVLAQLTDPTSFEPCVESISAHPAV